MTILRCEICNYTSQDGSDLRDVAPTRGNSVAWSGTYHRTLCWDCFQSIDSVAQEFQTQDDEDQSVEDNESSPALPVR